MFIRLETLKSFCSQINKLLELLDWSCRRQWSEHDVEAVTIHGSSQPGNGNLKMNSHAGVEDPDKQVIVNISRSSELAINPMFCFSRSLTCQPCIRGTQASLPQGAQLLQSLLPISKLVSLRKAN